MSAGADTVDFDAVPATLIVAANVGAYAQPMAEHVLGMTLALAKRLQANHARLAAGEYPADPETTELRGAVAGIVGFGGIGRACADLLRPLGVRIHAINTSGRTDADVEFVGGPADLERVLRAADVVVVAIPLTLETRGLIGARELAWMKPTAVLINVARAAIIDETALYEHLVATPGFSAGIDVWWDEPERGAAFHQRLPFLELPERAGIPAQLRHRRGHDRTRGGRRCTQRRPLPPGRAAPGGPAPGGLLLFGQDRVEALSRLDQQLPHPLDLLRRAALGDLPNRSERLENRATQVHRAGIGPLGDLVPGRGVRRAALGLGPALIRQRVPLATVGLLDRHQTLVLEHLERGVDRAGARLPARRRSARPARG